MNVKKVVFGVAVSVLVTASGVFVAGCNTLGTDNSVNSAGGDNQVGDNDDQGENGNGQNQKTCPSVYDISNVIYKGGPGLNDLYDSYRFPHHSGGSGEFYWEYYDYFVIKSANEKNELIARWRTEFEKRDLGWTWSVNPTNAWLEALEQYDDNYFKNNNLVMILKTEPSGSNKLEAASVTVKNKELNIVINRDGSGVTDDMGYWHILVPVQKCFFNGKKVNIETVDKVFHKCG